MIIQPCPGSALTPFLAAIEAAPADDQLRLQMADFIEEYYPGDPAAEGVAGLLRGKGI